VSHGPASLPLVAGAEAGRRALEEGVLAFTAAFNGLPVA